MSGLSAALDSNSGQTIDVLLVEDNAGDARLVETYLRKVDPRLLTGAPHLHHASSLTRALEMLDARSYDVMLVDLGLPESHGIDTLERLAANNSEVPIVVLTGLRDEELAFQAVQKGAEDFLHKDGLDGDRLARTLRHAIDRKQRKFELHLKTHAIESADLALALVELGESDSQVVHVNRACRKLSGYSTQEWMSRGLSVLFGESTETSSSAIFENAVRQGQKMSIEQLHYRKDGTSFWNKLVAMPIEGPSGAVTHLLYTFEDITDDRRWRARMADIDRMLTLGTVASGVAHEINNPLSFIAGNVQYVLAQLRDQLEEPGQPMSDEMLEGLIEALEDADDGNRRVRDIVRDLSDLAGGSADLDLPTERISIDGPLQSSLTVARNHIKDRARLVYEVEDMPEVWGNSSKLGQVFLNILVNAAQAIPVGDIEANEVRVATYMRDGKVIVEISDTGKGIAEADRDSIFEPFYSTKPSSEGTGLGLAISQLIVRQFGGDIDFESTVGEGTTFRVVLQCADQASLAASSTEVEAEE